MNAIIHDFADPMASARSSVGDLEIKLDLIHELADAALAVVERDLGAAHPANTLTALLSLIQNAAVEAEEERVRAFRLLR